MKSNVVSFTGVSSQETPPDQVLEWAKGKLDTLVIFGYDKNGAEYFASNYADGAEVLWLLERFKKLLLDTVDTMSDE